MDNPTRLLLEKTICELECIDLQLPTESITKSSDDDSRSATTHHPTSLAFASGLMAVTSILLAHSSPITVVMGDDLYHGTSTLFFDVFANHSNVRTIQVDMSQTSSIVDTISQVASDSTTRKPQNNDDDNKITTQHLKENIIIWMETPSNPKCQIVDIEAICKAVQHIQQQESIQPYVTCTTVVDGTMSSPVLTRSLNLGADISLHSATKYLGGHSDALLGILTTSPVTERGRALQPILRKVQVEAGGVASPWDSWLVLRGLRTLAVRVERQCRSALQLAEYLETKRIDEDRSSSLIHAVHYPGLTSHPQHGVASRQMEGGYGGVLSLELTDEVAAMAFAGALQTIHRATSLGGTETLIEHRASIEPPERTVSPPGLLRISVGLEDPDDLIRDMEKAFTITADICGEVA
jgi:cystathionine gamma-synthase